MYEQSVADVAVLQRLLGVEPDGVFGRRTAGAVAAWKRSRGLPASPDLSAEEERALAADVPLRAVYAMEAWLGLAEEPPRSNRVPVLAALAEHLGAAPALTRMGYPWCAFACFLAALAVGGQAADAGLRRQEFNAVYVPAVLRAARAGRFDLQVVPPSQAFRGDLALFDWDFHAGDPADHVGRLVAAPAGGRVRTVDGNSGGDGVVAVRERPAATVRAFVRDS